MLYRKLLETPDAGDAHSEKRPVRVAPPALEGHAHSFGRVLTVIRNACALLERDEKLWLLDLPVAERWLRQAQLTPGAETLCAQPLLIPVRIKVTDQEQRVLREAAEILNEMGIQTVLDHQHVTIRTVPLPLRQQNLQILIPELIGYLAANKQADSAHLAGWLARHLATEHEQWSVAQAITLLTDVERLCPNLVKSPPGGLLQPVDLQPAMNALKHD